MVALLAQGATYNVCLSLLPEIGGKLSLLPSTRPVAIGGGVSGPFLCLTFGVHAGIIYCNC